MSKINANNNYSFGFVLASLIAMFFAFVMLKNCSNSKINTVFKDRIILDTVYEIDTVILIKTYKPIAILDTLEDNDIEIRADTLITTNPFVAGIDTNLRQQGIDSLNVKFYFPERIFEISVLKTADTNLVINKEIIRNIEAKKEFYESWEFGLGTGIIGLLIGIFVAK